MCHNDTVFLLCTIFTATMKHSNNTKIKMSNKQHQVSDKPAVHVVHEYKLLFFTIPHQEEPYILSWEIRNKERGYHVLLALGVAT